MCKPFFYLHFYLYTMYKSSIWWILYSDIVYEYKIQRILYLYTMSKSYFYQKEKQYTSRCSLMWHDEDSAYVDGRPCDFGRLRRPPMAPQAKRRDINTRRWALRKRFGGSTGVRGRKWRVCAFGFKIYICRRFDRGMTPRQRNGPIAQLVRAPDS